MSISYLCSFDGHLKWNFHSIANSDQYKWFYLLYRKCCVSLIHIHLFINWNIYKTFVNFVAIDYFLTVYLDVDLTISWLEIVFLRLVHLRIWIIKVNKLLIVCDLLMNILLLLRHWFLKIFIYLFIIWEM